MFKNGYTATEAFIAVVMLLSGVIGIAGSAALVYVAVHFISKVW